MPAIAHLGDALSHGGAVIEASGTVFADGRAVARIGDRVSCAQHGLQRIVSGAESVVTNGRGTAIDGSRCSCGARVIATGTVFAEG